LKKLKLLCFILCFSILLSVSCLGNQVSYEEDISDVLSPIECVETDLSVGTDLGIKAKSAILMEAKTGEILYEQNSNEITAPASITKIMSLLLIMEAIDAKKLTEEEVVTASEYAASMGGSQIWLEPEESMTVHDLLKATVVASANDATVALAEHIAGSEENFVVLMNKRAKELGMNNTAFVNCTGLDTEGHYTCAYDVALMSRELIKHPIIKNYTTIWMDTIRNGESELVNTNKLIRFYDGATGLKTGTTSKAGSCLSATAQKNETELIAVIMGGENSKERFSGAKKMLDFGFSNFTYKELTPEIEKNFSIPVADGTQKTIGGESRENLNVLLKKGEDNNITQKIVAEDSVKAPIKKGDKIGEVDFFVGDEQIGSIDIVAKNDIDKINIKTVFLWLLIGLFTA